MNRNDSLKRKKDFRYTYRVGKSVQHRYFSCIIAKNRLNKTRIGITVSKKQGNSVQRNRIKRRIREAVTLCIPEMKKGINVILVGRHSVLEAPFQDICVSVRETLERANAFSETTE